MPTSPRPRWNHQSVKDLAVEEIIEPVREWAESSGLTEETKAPDFKAVIALALYEATDAYHAGRYIEDFYGWPVDNELLQYLQYAFRCMRTLVTPATHEWVVKYGIRFPAKKGELVRCRVGDTEIKGVVTEIMSSTARGLLKVDGMSGPWFAEAEDIIENLGKPKPKKERKK